MKLMIIEDQRIILQGIIRMFSHFCGDDEVHGFSDPVAALEAMPALKPDAVFTDIVMEGMDGLALIGRAKALLPACRFVIISGFAEFEYARRAIGLGVDAYLVKPIDRSELEAAYRGVKALAEQSQPQQSPEPNRRPTLSEQAMAFIRDHRDRPLTVHDVAAHIHIAPNYLSNVFRKETGTSVTEVIRCEQMRAAARLLRDTDMYLYEIAERLGYRDVKHFSLLFKEYYQITPKTYRQRCLQEAENPRDDSPNHSL